MDHVGQFAKDGRVMSQVPVGGVDLCDNLPKPEALTAQTRNLNETNTLTQNQSLSASQPEDGGGHRLLHNTSLNNNGQDVEEEQGKEGHSGRGQIEDEEEDIDEVMKEEEEEEEESEESSALIRCQSPDTPMTDSSYSETGSLLETPYPLSPGPISEPTSPVIPVSSPGTLCPISLLELNQSDADMDSHISSTELVACTTGTITLGHKHVDSITVTVTSDARPTSPPGPIFITGATEHYTSSTEPIFNHGPIYTGGSASLYSEPQGSLRLNTSIASTTGPRALTTGPMTTGTESTSTTGPITSNWELINSLPVPTCFSVSTSTAGPIQTPTPLECLEQLAHRGDDTHFPQYLHQIAETFVLHNDYQQALWCIQLERLYHQRVLDNLSALQEQWESKCRTSSILGNQHLDALKHICLTHSRPRTRDVVCASLDFVKPTFEKGGAPPACVSAHEVDGGMDKIAKDPSSSQSSHLGIPSVNLADRLKSPEISQKQREIPDGEIEGSDNFRESQLTDKDHSNREGGEVEADATGNFLHPSTTGAMDQSKPAEQQGGESGPAQEKEAKKEDEERDVEEAVDALEMKDEGEEEEEEKQKKSAFGQKALPVEIVVSGAEVEVQQLHQETPAEEKLREETQESAKACQHQEAHLPQEAHVKQQKQGEEDEEEEEEEEYEIEQADVIREAASLDDMAKRITVEEMSPASGLVSILKKRSVCVENVSVSASSEVQPDKPTAKRRVRFKVPDDGYEQDVGGGDSCLLLFLLCLVTVVISVGGTALYCALGDVHSSVCQDFSRNADFYFGQIQRGITQIQYWLSPGS